MPTSPAPDRPAVRSFLALALAFAAAAAVGVLGGMIGLGGAEFPLPLLIMLFGFAALQAVILNKALSLVVVLTALPARPCWRLSAGRRPAALLSALLSTAVPPRPRPTPTVGVVVVRSPRT
ncbi:hypothetical protein OG470_21550 [Micromonospora sp. NBC_00389]|uniref:hypothetical protein n=1 Tax=Micromonospora sp. NBC_00389 TaxID=2903586 RepID=UPI002E1A8C54